MSRRGVFPLFIAIGFGVINGIWAFGPALKEGQSQAHDISKSIYPSPPSKDFNSKTTSHSDLQHESNHQNDEPSKIRHDTLQSTNDQHDKKMVSPKEDFVVKSNNN
ncbi:CSEP0310 putative effector protein [Blumeria hordei DH14]|uniref:CSEP0310 putative effector protein n=1 Tax=Blumeria graminis f. sp. hordei (strain DH14) TaxID=546991 RepID=N1JAM4_BLUG1|nr:CSEP0310 putative effector protein [Blumeria hordei DH14]